MQCRSCNSSSSSWRQKEEKVLVLLVAGVRQRALAFTCNLLRELEPEAKRKAFEDSELCLFCIKHSAETERFGKGTTSKPACKVPECTG